MNQLSNLYYIKIKNKEILLEIALTINKELFDDNKISYKTYKYTEENILKDLNTLSIEYKK